ncbi:programmed cell death protein 2-like [Planococcus citri]|uniref:programmed cell death protein 2-like n=1 Tax=Planococcus citri TaxID=170843 RepID=UPI0031FA398E
MVDKSKVLLGFVDEPITDNYKEEVDYTTNKLGGHPDWITAQTDSTIICKVCRSVTPLLLQIYAPVTEKINQHRTLYIFACLNPTCWGISKSWTCIKNQMAMKKKQDSFVSNFSNDDWCTDSNNWNCDSNNTCNSSLDLFLENEASSMLSRVTVCAEENANVIPDRTCVDVLDAPASAEIEPDENEPIMVDSPTVPHCDLSNLLKQVPTSPKVYREDTYFVPSFIYVMEERLERDPLSEHVQMLLTEYSRSSENRNSLKITKNVNVSRRSDDEVYERSRPLHGDKLFHTFLSRIKLNPDQIIRYCRSNEAPLFLFPELDIPAKCKHCNGEMVFEMQILPTIINYLRLNGAGRAEKDILEFGSVFIYSCQESCDKPDGEECVLIQMETF